MDCRTCRDVPVVDTYVKPTVDTHVEPPERTARGLAGDTKLGKNWKYGGFAVISIDFKKAPEKAGYDITFDESTKGEDNPGYEDEATFIHNIKWLNEDDEDKNGKRIYSADKLTVKEAQAKFEEKYGSGTKAFFYIHGNITEAGFVFSSTKKQQSKFAKSKIIPVIWPSEVGVTSYLKNKRKYVPVAVTELNTLLKTVTKDNLFKGKNLICHSLGNFLLRKIANEEKNTKVKFDNIFMVAADVRHNLFDEDYINRDGGSKDGLNIFRMLDTNSSTGKPKGKIHVLSNWDDGPLETSSWLNALNRLGQAGMGTYDKWWYGWGINKNLVHPEIRDYYNNFDAGKLLTTPGRHGNIDRHDKDEHGYTWYEFAVNYYKWHMDKPMGRQAEYRPFFIPDEKMHVKGSIEIKKVATLPKSDKDHLSLKHKVVLRASTLRIIEEANANPDNVRVEACVGTSLAAGDTFPFESVSVTGTDEAEYLNCLDESLEIKTSYEVNANESFELSPVRIYVNDSEVEDLVVYSKTITFGGVMIEKSYDSCPASTFKERKTDVIVSYQSPVDYQWYRLRTKNSLYLSCNQHKKLTVQRSSQSSCHFFRWDKSSIVCFAGGQNRNYRVATSANSPKDRQAVIAWHEHHPGEQGSFWSLDSEDEVVKVNITDHSIKNGHGFVLTAMDGRGHACKPGNTLRQVGGHGMDGQSWTMEYVTRIVKQ